MMYGYTLLVPMNQSKFAQQDKQGALYKWSQVIYDRQRNLT